MTTTQIWISALGAGMTVAIALITVALLGVIYLSVLRRARK